MIVDIIKAEAGELAQNHLDDRHRIIFAQGI